MLKLKQIFFYRTSFSQNWHKVFLGEGDSSEGQCPFPKGDNTITASENTVTKFKKSFRTTGQFSTKLGTKHPWVKEIDSRFYKQGPFKPQKEIMGLFVP